MYSSLVGGGAWLDNLVVKCFVASSVGEGGSGDIHTYINTYMCIPSYIERGREKES